MTTVLTHFTPTVGMVSCVIGTLFCCIFAMVDTNMRKKGEKMRKSEKKRPFEKVPALWSIVIVSQKVHSNK